MSPELAPLSPRARAKAERRRQILLAAARLMARHGYHSVRLDAIGAEVGISGPAMYRHFPSKEQVLVELLLDISRLLNTEGRRAAIGGGPRVLDRLLELHIDIVLREPDLITVQYRDLGSLPDAARHEVRTLQREYVDVWVTALLSIRPDLVDPVARAHVRAVFGLLNSSPLLPDLPTDQLKEMLERSARAALLA